MGFPYIYPLKPGTGCGDGEDGDQYCDNDKCQECCQHDDMDHGECIECGLTVY